MNGQTIGVFGLGLFLGYYLYIALNYREVKWARSRDQGKHDGVINAARDYVYSNASTGPVVIALVNAVSELDEIEPRGVST